MLSVKKWPRNWQVPRPWSRVNNRNGSTSMAIAEIPDIHNHQSDGIPHNIDAEQAVLGALLMQNALLEDVADIIGAEAFYDPLHGALFTEIAKLIDGGRAADLITLKPIVNGWPPISETMQVWQYLGRLLTAAASRVEIKGYARLLRDLSDRRRVVYLAQDVLSLAMADPSDVPTPDVIETAERGLFEIGAKRTEGRETSIDGAVHQALETISNAYERGGELNGVRTGLIDLDRILGGFQASDLIILGGRPSMGKMQATDSRVLASDGTWRMMGDLKIGDSLASVDGRPSIVTGVFPHGAKQLYRVTFSDGRSTEAGAEHLWRVMYREWDSPKVVDTAKVIKLLGHKRYRGRLWVDLVSGDFGHDANLPIDAYTLGTIISNGGISGKGVLISTPYHSVIGRVQKEVANHGAYLSHACDVTWRMNGSASIKSGLRSLGLMGLTSDAKFIPQAYLSASRPSRASLLQGLIDGDGWVEKFGAIRYGTSSYRLACDVQDLVRSLGGLATVSQKNPRYRYKGQKMAGRKAWVVNIMFADGSPYVSVPFKLNRVSNRSRQPRLTFKSIEPSRIHDAQCISVSHPEQLYVTDDYIVTHNTALALTIAFNVARDAVDSHGVVTPGGHVHFFSQEMSASQLAMRLIAERSEIASDTLRRGAVNENELRSAIEGAKQVSAASMTIDETGGISLGALIAKARRVKRKKDTKLIVVDYLQLMSGTKNSDNRVQEITKLTMGLKALAKELDVPIVALSQLSRKVEERADKRPQLADLRESGSIEQDADVVMFVYRDEYYIEREKPDDADAVKYADWLARMDRAHGKAEVLVAKQRHGAVGSVALSFQSKFTRFGNLGGGHGGR